MSPDHYRNADKSPVHWMHVILAYRQVEIAAILDIHTSYVSSYLAGKRPSGEVAKKMKVKFLEHIDDLEESLTSSPPQGDYASDITEEIIRTSRGYGNSL